MKEINNHIEELLVKFLSGEATAEEIMTLKKWASVSSENETTLAQYKTIWEAASNLSAKPETDEDAAWKRMQALLPDTEMSSTRRIYRYPWLQAAAIIILVISVSFLGYYRLFKIRGNKTPVVAQAPKTSISDTSLTFIVSGDQRKTDTLPDQSIVELNTHSTLTYADTLSVASHRFVELQGSAFFKVKHNVSRPFTVKAGRLLITVLGTSFYVKMPADTVEVSVETGIVAVTDEKNSVLLKAGESAILAGKGDLAYLSNGRDNGQHKTIGSLTGNVGKKYQKEPAFDINQHPDLIRQLMQDPQKWASLLKNYSPGGNDIEFCRRIINNVLDDLENQGIIQRDNVRDFKLDGDAFIINGTRQPQDIFVAFKNKYIKEQGYVICLGDYKKTGKGVFLLRKDL